MSYTLNPLGDNLAWAWDVIALILTFIVIQALVLVNGFLQRRELLPTYITRKVIHIFAAPLYLVCWLLFSGAGGSRYFAMIVPLAFVAQFAAIGLGWRQDESFVKSMSRSGDPRELLGGTMHYAIVMFLVTVLFFDSGVPGAPVNPAALVILGCLAGGDGLADIIGRRFGGKPKFGVGEAEKTYVGSAAMFVGSVLMSLLLIVIFSLGTQLQVGEAFLPALILSLIAAIAEGFSPKGVDNYLISLAVFIGILILSATPLWPYAPLFTL